MGYFWNRMTADIQNSIKNCGICYSEANIQKLEKKIILTKGHNIRYQVLIQYIPNELKIGHEYFYFLNIIEHYSK